jgi:UDP:flavonoid glycosyltransferase YjiC (YdhE family)
MIDLGEHQARHFSMPKILLATIGSLGDLHPKIALALELRNRGHEVTVAAMEFYREKIEMLGFRFLPMAPHLTPDNMDLAPDLMDERKGTEVLLKEIIIPAVRPMFDDLMAAAAGADLMVTGEVVFAARSVAERTGIKWISTSLAPISFISAHDPPVPAQAPWLEALRPLGPMFHRPLYAFMKWSIDGWFDGYRVFRREIGLKEGGNPLFAEKYSERLHLAMFSKVLGAPQPDWPRQTLQTGFCYYDGQADLGKLPDNVDAFLNAGDPPIVFTLGSAAVMDARDFFDQSAGAAGKLNRRAILIYGIYNDPPKGLDDKMIGVDYAPYSRIFPRAACVVHQGGVGTTGQVLRAGVPHLIMPFGHDQPDNAARCRRLGVAEVIARNSYDSESAAAALGRILSDPKYGDNARRVSEIVRTEHGTETACDAIEDVLRN